MTITLTDEEAQDYIDYHEAIQVAKRDSLGLVVTSDEYNQYITNCKEHISILKEQYEQITTENQTRL